MIRKLDDTTFVSGQVTPAEIAQFKDEGVTLIINNRPDGEDQGQPCSAEIEDAAVKAGIAYRHIPIVRGIGPADVELMRQALESADGKVLAFCRSGTRSALAWAVARRHQGASVAQLEAAAADAGVDIGPIAHLL
ncbi:TIGR01244 family phosphatase [Sphingomonas sinipercae]|uniref:TIGR01244 family phosphatase n=1 Tax=Sphingomonas sinipercae TaxID=2714944 RepID=A0A6G7ZL01_9SPHN|nr:TIGR01244 family sulfur transferase [Sphingomonas sinipercae]QIL01598.1 TIGR01244 family phosphatase [Sphingomonas sinipercae]